MGPPPVVTGISPKEGPPGTRVTIRGEFLGTSATDLFGLKICSCDCLLSAEWKSKNKIVARSGPCKGRGDIIVTTRSGGEGTSTVQFRGYHELIGPVKESAVWVEEATVQSSSWGRRPLSPATYTEPDPLGLSTEGEDCKFPEEELQEMFPECSGKLTDENFHPGWYLLEHHSMTSYEDLQAGMLYLQRKLESQKDGELTFLKANTGAVMEQLDRLVLLKNVFHAGNKGCKEPLASMRTAIEGAISSADALYSEILADKDRADKMRSELALLNRHKFLFQLPQTIDNNIRRKEYELVVNDYTRVKNLFGKSDVKVFQKILDEIDSKIENLKEKLHTRIQTMPINVQEQRKLIRLLLSLQWAGDAGWDAIVARKEYLVSLLNKLRDYFKQKDDADADKGKRGRGGREEGARAGAGVGAGDGEGEWGGAVERWCGAACAALADETCALWTLARCYFAGELQPLPAANDNSELFKEMMIESVEVWAGQMRGALMGGGVGGTGGVPGGTGAGTVRARLAANLRHLRHVHDTLLKLDMPSQPVAIVEKVIFEYRVHGMVTFLGRALRRVRALADKETWKVEEFSDYGAITKLPRLLESYMCEALSSIHACVAGSGRRESPLLGGGSDTTTLLHRHTAHILLAYPPCLQRLADSHPPHDCSNTSLSQALKQSMDESSMECADSSGPSWHQRLLVQAANAQYTRRVILDRIEATFEQYGFPKPVSALQSAKDALSNLEASIGETYLEHKGDPLVGTIEPSMYLSKYRIEEAALDDARPYVYEIINNLIAVHAEVDSVCGGAWSRHVSDICETVCEELARLGAGAGAGSGPGAQPPPALALQHRAELTLLRLALHAHLTRNAENHLIEAMAALPPLTSEEDVRKMERIVNEFKKRMRLQLESLNCTTETI